MGKTIEPRIEPYYIFVLRHYDAMMKKERMRKKYDNAWESLNSTEYTKEYASKEMQSY